MQSQIETINTSLWNNIISIIGDFRVLIYALSIIVLIVLILKYCFLHTKKSIQQSRNQINVFRANGKYIDNLFVETNKTKELIRYFIYGNSWRHRIIRQFNRMYNYRDIDLIYSYARSNVLVRHLKRSATIIDIQKAIDYNKCFFASYNDNIKNPKLFSKSEPLVRSVDTYMHLEFLDWLKCCVDASSNRFVIIKGSAGNGKTNLLCNMVQHIIALKNPVLFINAASIKSDVFKYILEKMQIPTSLKKHEQFLFWIINLKLQFLRKYHYIVIDAINENDNEAFITSLAIGISKLLNNKRIKIALTCRSEYFDERYDRLFTDQEVSDVFIYDIETDFHYLTSDDSRARAKKRLHFIYRNHFKFNGHISKTVIEKLSKSMLLTRIFYEVNEKSSANILSLNRFELYTMYIDRIIRREDARRFEELLKKVIQKLIKQEDFTRIPIKALSMSSEDVALLKRVADKNMLLYLSILRDKDNIAQREEEYISFVFDELRDFCIARYLAIQFRNGSISIEYLKQFVLNLITNRYSPAEGVLKYTYTFLKHDEKYAICNELLESSQIDRRQIHRERNTTPIEHNEIFDMGLNIILDGQEDILDFEKKYIEKHLLDKTPDSQSFFKYLLENHQIEVQPNLSLLIEILFNLVNENDVQYIIESINLHDQSLFDQIFLDKRFEYDIDIRFKDLVIYLLIQDAVFDSNFRRYRKINKNQMDQIIKQIGETMKCETIRLRIIERINENWNRAGGWGFKEWEWEKFGHDFQE